MALPRIDYDDVPIEGEFDCVVVGSGFGGSVVAAEVAKEGLSVLVLERGKEYPPGKFARSPLEASTNFWDPTSSLYGLFDIWSFRRFEAVVSSGVGGGSLIYANVMLPKPAKWFDGTDGGESWPISRTDLDPHYAGVQEALGVGTITSVVPKMTVFQDAANRAGMTWQRAPLAVSFSPEGESLGLPVGTPADNYHRVQRTTCRMCGQCDVGCNYGSKNTMDLTYLSWAKLRHHAVIKSGHEVWGIMPIGDASLGLGYWVYCQVHTLPDPPWRRPHEPPPDKHVRFCAKTLVLAAGSLGSTYLLLRNRSENLPKLSPQLGTRFSGNGDYLGFFTGNRKDFAASDGPVITGYVQGPDALDGNGDIGRGYVLQDGGYPTLAEWMLEETSFGPLRRTVRVASRLLWARYLTRRPRTEVSSSLTDAIGRSRRSRGTLPMLGFGRDLPKGYMTLDEDDNLKIDWDDAFSEPVFRPIQNALRELAQAMGFRFRQITSTRLSRIITVHPVGGCPMSHTIEGGVVDTNGEVFSYPNLFVADGSVMPGPVGVNPSLTIAAVARMFSERIIKSAGRS